MPLLYLLRHAKSSRQDRSLADRDRPLAPRGRRAASAMARHMAERGWLPDRVLCSAAVRTRQTWELARLALGDPPTVFVDALYGAPAGDVLDVVRVQGGTAQGLLVVGHNPGVETLASRLAAAGPEREMERMRDEFPTAALAVLRFDVPRWADVREGGGELVAFVRPKDLEGGEGEG